MATQNQDQKELAKIATSEKDEDILSLARSRFDLAVEAETEIREEALDDLKFRAGDQWPGDVKNARDLDRRPCLTINRLPQYIRQVTNDQRQNRPSIKVDPVDDLADIETAKVYQGLIRHIEYNSNADVAYDTAFEGAATKGIGYFRIVTDFCDPKSFEQEILIKRIRNSFSVYLDPHYQEPDGSDANWGFIFEDMSADDYRAQYKNSELASMHDWESIGDSAAGWANKETVRVAEYFYKTFKEVTYVMLNTKEVVDKSQLPEILPEGVEIVAERKSMEPAIKWCKINAVEVLEKTDWPGRWIPIIPVLGDELDIDGKKVLEGVIRHAKDPQRMYNYWASSETETIALAPRAPFIGVEGQFEGHEEKWATANSKNHAYLEYKPTSISGQPVGAPQRQAYEPPVQAITQARMQSSEDLKATTGIYDASLGARSNENSGVAIQRRNMQAQTNNFHFIDNLTRALRHSGRILIDLIPHVYDTARTVRIMGEDETVEMVAINQVFEKQGEQVEHKMGHGKYDVTIATGPSFATKRQEAAAAMLDFTKAMPQQAAIISDLLVRNMDWPGAKEIADRLKKTLPPGIAEEKEGDKKPLPPEVQAQMQQMQQMVEQLTAKLNESHDELDQKTRELESKERIEFAKMQVDLQKAIAQLDQKDSALLMQTQFGQIQSQQQTQTSEMRAHIQELQQRLELLDINQPIEDEQNENLENENLNGAGPDAAMASQPNMSTGGLPPGQIPGEG